MATFGQMLAASQAYGSPDAQRKLAQTDSLKSEYEVGVQKKSQQQELQALMEEELAKASGSGGWGLLGDLGKVLSFVPGIGTGVGAGLQALSGAGTAGSQKSKLEKLMKGSKFDKYKNSWLGDPTKAYMKDVKGLAGNIDPLKTGLTSLATSMVTGKIAKGIGEKFKGAFTPETAVSGIEGQSLIDTGIPGSMDGSFSLDDRLSGKVGKVGINLGDLTKPDLLAGLDKSALGSRIAGSTIEASGLKGLFKDFDLMDILEGAGEGTENLQALPLLLQMFGSGGGQESDASGYF